VPTLEPSLSPAFSLSIPRELSVHVLPTGGRHQLISRSPGLSCAHYWLAGDSYGALSHLSRSYAPQRVRYQDLESYGLKCYYRGRRKLSDRKGPGLHDKGYEKKIFFGTTLVISISIPNSNLRHWVPY
jgi:hypothetical protein